MDAQLLDIYDMTRAKGALIHVVGGEDMTLEEVNRAGELVQQHMSPDTKMIWGARVDENMTGRVRVMVALTSVDCSFLTPHAIPPTPTQEEPSKKKGFFRKFFQ